MRIALENWLAPSHYTATPSVARATPREEAIDVREDLASLILHGERETGGIADLPHTIEIERHVTTAAASTRAFQGDDLRRLWSLTWMLAVTEWRLRFYGSVLGYVWSLARPFALFGVIYVVFSEFAEFGEGVPYYAAYILFALVLFQFFIEVDDDVGAVAGRSREPAA